jgi:hypothetical protein
MNTEKRTIPCIILLAMVAVCAAIGCASKGTSPESNAPPVQTGIVTDRINHNNIRNNIFVGDVVRVCDHVSSGAESMAGPLPVYPHMKQIGAGADGMPGGLVRVYSSDDPYEIIYGWYQRAMPSGSEHDWTKCGPMLKTTPPTDVALFSVGTLDKDYRAVFIVGFPKDQIPHGWPKGTRVPRTMITLKVR